MNKFKFDDKKITIIELTLQTNFKITPGGGGQMYRQGLANVGILSVDPVPCFGTE